MTISTYTNYLTLRWIHASLSKPFTLELNYSSMLLSVYLWVYFILAPPCVHQFLPTLPPPPYTLPNTITSSPPRSSWSSSSRISLAWPPPPLCRYHYRRTLFPPILAALILASCWASSSSNYLNLSLMSGSTSSDTFILSVIWGNASKRQSALFRFYCSL